MNIQNNDTIAAVSTPLGEGGIGIIRLSGSNSFSIVEKIFKPLKGNEVSAYKSHTVHFGNIIHPETSEVLDEVLVTFMCKPCTYTKEDIIEINCHGGVVPVKRILELCINTGARLAEPGEFTKRAFLNGRIDLSQAEAVLDIIKSETEASCKVAVEQLKGKFSDEVRNLRNDVFDVLSLIELTIDFSQEDVGFEKSEDISNRIKKLKRGIEDILATFDKGMILRDGASVVICGRPNVGKSSLMNNLLKHERVIVTDIAGTTRDVIEESIRVAGVKVRLSDTAGIIDTDEAIEKEGIRRSRQKLESADIVLFMLDNTRDLNEMDKEIYDFIKDKKNIIIVNKCDRKEKKIDLNEVKKIFNSGHILKVSVLENKGLEKIEDTIAKELFDGSCREQDAPVITNIRHKDILTKSLGALEEAMKVTGKNYNAELLASDLNETIYLLGLIIGESVSDDILDRIFSQFCIGK